MRRSALTAALLACLSAPAAATRVYQSEYYDTEAQARAALRSFEAAAAAADLKLAFDQSTEQVRPVGDSFYFAVAYEGFALPAPEIYSSSTYGSAGDASSALRWFLDAVQPAPVKIVESGVRNRGDQSYFWVRYLGPPLAKPLTYSSASYASDDLAQGGLQSCLGTAYKAKAIVLEKDVRPGKTGPFFWVRYLGAKLACGR